MRDSPLGRLLSPVSCDFLFACGRKTTRVTVSLCPSWPGLYIAIEQETKTARVSWDSDSAAHCAGCSDLPPPAALSAAFPGGVSLAACGPRAPVLSAGIQGSVRLGCSAQDPYKGPSFRNVRAQRCPCPDLLAYRGPWASGTVQRGRAFRAMPVFWSHPSRDGWKLQPRGVALNLLEAEPLGGGLDSARPPVPPGGPCSGEGWAPAVPAGGQGPRGCHVGRGTRDKGASGPRKLLVEPICSHTSFHARAGVDLRLCTQAALGRAVCPLPRVAGRLVRLLPPPTLLRGLGTGERSPGQGSPAVPWPARTRAPGPRTWRRGRALVPAGHTGAEEPTPLLCGDLWGRFVRVCTEPSGTLPGCSPSLAKRRVGAGSSGLFLLRVSPLAPPSDSPGGRPCPHVDVFVGGGALVSAKRRRPWQLRCGDNLAQAQRDPICFASWCPSLQGTEARLHFQRAQGTTATACPRLGDRPTREVPPPWRPKAPLGWNPARLCAPPVSPPVAPKVEMAQRQLGQCWGGGPWHPLCAGPFGNQH